MGKLLLAFFAPLRLKIIAKSARVYARRAKDVFQIRMSELTNRRCAARWKNGFICNRENRNRRENRIRRRYIEVDGYLRQVSFGSYNEINCRADKFANRTRIIRNRSGLLASGFCVENMFVQCRHCNNRKHIETESDTGSKPAPKRCPIFAEKLFGHCNTLDSTQSGSMCQEEFSSDDFNFRRDVLFLSPLIRTCVKQSLLKAGFTCELVSQTIDETVVP